MLARDGVLIEMQYIHFGDSFGASMPPRPALRELAIATVRGMPKP